MFRNKLIKQKMKKINLLLLVTISLVFFASCTNNKKTADNDAELTPATVDEILAMAEQEAENVVVVEGVCTHICSHGGKKLFLMGDDDSKTIRVESTDALGAFKSECVNSLIRVKGKLKEERIDEAYLVKWESEIAEGTAEEHGEDGEVCETELQAQGQDSISSAAGSIKDFRTRIAERTETEGKNYLSFYYIEADEYSIL